MAMTNIRSLIKIEITIDPEGNHSVFPIYQYTIDDPEDDMLPIITSKGFTIRAGDDVTAHDVLVQNICAEAYEGYVVDNSDQTTLPEGTPPPEE
jgi:hypothetical protein